MDVGGSSKNGDCGRMASNSESMRVRLIGRKQLRSGGAHYRHSNRLNQGSRFQRDI